MGRRDQGGAGSSRLTTGGRSEGSVWGAAWSRHREPGERGCVVVQVVVEMSVKVCDDGVQDLAIEYGDE